MNNIMMVVLIFSAIILMIVGFSGILFGIDLKKASGWSFVICGFLAGALIGVSNGDFKAAVILGTIIALSVAYSGEMVRRQKAMFSPPGKPSRKKRKTYK